MNWTNLLLLLIFIASFSLTLIIVPFIRKFANNKKIFDHPGGRKGHSNQIPLLGGVAIWSGFVTSIMIAIGSVFLLRQSTSVVEYIPNLSVLWQNISIGIPGILTIIIVSIGITVLGLLDDLIKNGLHYRTKFIFQVLMISFVVASGVSVHVFPWPWLNLLISFFWILGITNAINLLDGMDGLAAGVVAISATGFLLLAVSSDLFYATILLVSLIGCCIGFLRYNFSPARIFMGDAGSLLLGFLLSSTAIICLNSAEPVAASPVALFPIMVLSIPIYDTFSVLFIRIRNRRHPFVGDKNHFFHRMVRFGLSKRNTVFLIYVLNVIAVISAFVLFRLSWWESLMMLTMTGGLYILLPHFVYFIGKRTLPAHSISKEALNSGRSIIFDKEKAAEISSKFNSPYFRKQEELRAVMEHSEQP